MTRQEGKEWESHSERSMHQDQEVRNKEWQNGVFLRNLELSFNLILGQHQGYNWADLGRSPILTSQPRQSTGGLFSLFLLPKPCLSNLGCHISSLMKHRLPLPTGAGSRRSLGWAVPGCQPEEPNSSSSSRSCPTIRR